MTTLIQITDLSGRTIHFNPDHVIMVQDLKPGMSCIRLTEDRAITVSMSAADASRMIDLSSV